jgi:hypothetical protein
MSIWTKDQIFFSADKRTYWSHDPGANSGNGAAVLTLNGVDVISLSSDDVSVTGDMTVGGTLVGGLSGLVPVGGLSLAVSSGIAALSTLSAYGVSVLTATAAGPIYVMPAPSSAGILKIILQTEADSTHHIDFGAGVFVDGQSTLADLHMTGQCAVGLLSISATEWRILFRTSTTSVSLATGT